MGELLEGGGLALGASECSNFLELLVMQELDPLGWL